MVLYTCNNCKKEFTKKSNYNYHINKKKSCNNILNNLKCLYCNKIFSYKHTLLRHINKYCNKKKELNFNENNQIKLKELELKEKELEYNKKFKEKELELKEKEIYNQKELKLKKLELKEKEINYKINKKINNITNNITNNTNNITINIVAFGSEKLEEIPDEKIKSFLNRGFMSVIQMVNYLNCNKDLPEYNNIYISNKRDNTITTYNGENWITSEKDTTLDTILNKNGNFLEKRYNEFSMSISKFEQFKNGRYNEEQNEFMKDKLNLLLYNNKNLIKLQKKNYNKIM
jgi:hypothetical protein